MRGIVIAGTHSGCGKTTVTLGLLAALKKKGLVVQSFKAGPDFIDSGLHRLITGRPSRNLDLWMCGKDYVKACFEKNSEDADIAVVEGVMGMYDGALSTADLAAFLGLPVVLVVDGYGMAESAGAVVKGFVDFELHNIDRGNSKLKTQNSKPCMAGVIFNRVASEKHYERLRKSVRDIPVLGYLPRDLSFEIPHRHLGLTVAEESPIADENIERLADAVLRHIDIEAVMRQGARGKRRGAINEGPIASRLSTATSLAVAYDRAFCFYYEDNLDLLREAGMEIVKFSPLADPSLPGGVDAVYIGGGYPELHARELSGNRSMLEALHVWANEGKPMYAECGGLMYLSQGIYDFEGTFFPMARVFPFETVMKRGRSRLGYREVILDDDCIIGKKGDRLRGHEFHYSEIKDAPQSGAGVYSVRDGSGSGIGSEGYRFRNTLASYIHAHFGSNPSVAINMVHFLTGINRNQKRTHRRDTEARRKTKI